MFAPLFFLVSLVIFRDSPSCLELTMSERSVILSGANFKSTVTVTTKNCSNETLLFFNLKGKVANFNEEIDGNGSIKKGAGFELFIENDSGIVHIEHIVYNGEHRYSFDSIKSMLEIGKQTFIKNTETLRPSGSITLKKEIDFQAFSLKPGKYRLWLTYYSDVAVLDLLSEKDIRSLQGKQKTRIFQGAMTTNKITLTVA